MQNNFNTSPATVPAWTVKAISPRLSDVKHALDSYLDQAEKGIIRTDSDGFVNVGKMVWHRLFSESAIRLDDIMHYIESDAGSDFEKKGPFGPGTKNDGSQCFLRKKQVRVPPRPANPLSEDRSDI